jgi:hypothetical protein
VDAKRQSYRTPSFLEKFIELNKVMWSVNQGLSKTHTYGSRPKVRGRRKADHEIKGVETDQRRRC